MTYDADGRKALDLVQVRAVRKLEEIHRLLAPGQTPPLSEDDLRRAAHEHMASLPSEEKEKLRLKAMVAFGQLERLMAEMSQHLSAIGDELNKVNRQSRALGAYGQASRIGRSAGAV